VTVAYLCTRNTVTYLLTYLFTYLLTTLHYGVTAAGQQLGKVGIIYSVFDLLIDLFIYSLIHIIKKIKTYNVHISAMWTKWPTQGQATYVSP